MVLQGSGRVTVYSGKSQTCHFYIERVWLQPGGFCVLTEGADVLTSDFWSDFRSAQDLTRSHFKDMSVTHILFIQSSMNFPFSGTSLPVTARNSPRVTPHFNRQSLRCPVTQCRSLPSGPFCILQPLHAGYATHKKPTRTEIHEIEHEYAQYPLCRHTKSFHFSTERPAASIRRPRINPAAPCKRCPVAPGSCSPAPAFLEHFVPFYTG